MTPRRRVVVVEDDAMVREWIRGALDGSALDVVATTADAGAVLELCRYWDPAVVLVDYRLPDTVGTEVIKALRAAGLSAPAVLMTANRQRGFNESARESGAQGTVLKTGDARELLDVLGRVVEGDDAFDARHPRRDRSEAPLSPRERDVLRLVAVGATNPQIAAELGVGAETVKTLVARILTKLGASRRAEAVSEAHRRGLI